MFFVVVSAFDLVVRFNEVGAVVSKMGDGEVFWSCFIHWRQASRHRPKYPWPSGAK